MVVVLRKKENRPMFPSRMTHFLRGTEDWGVDLLKMLCLWAIAGNTGKVISKNGNLVYSVKKIIRCPRVLAKIGTDKKCKAGQQAVFS